MLGTRTIAKAATPPRTAPWSVAPARAPCTNRSAEYVAATSPAAHALASTKSTASRRPRTSHGRITAAPAQTSAGASCRR